MTTLSIPFNVPTTNPEAFSQEWQEWNEAVEASIEPEPEPLVRDALDLVREADEAEDSLSDDERDAINTRREAEWEKFYDSGIDFPYEQ